MSTACLLYQTLFVLSVSPQASALPLPRASQAIIFGEATVAISHCSGALARPCRLNGCDRLPLGG
eukprot:4891791-Alexandrium_andersonii.AAC.1